MNVTELVFEMMWDCKYCGQKKLLGLTHRCCANCGAPQDPATRYFPPENEKIAVQNHPYVGADVACPACKMPMSRAVKCCTNCGSPIDKGVEVHRQQEVFVAAPLPKKSNTKAIVLGIVGVVLAGIIGLVVTLVLWKRETALQVTARTWERDIAVERYDLNRRSAWCDSAPIGGHELGRHKEQRGTNKIKDGETCSTRKKDQGNGTYKEVKECTPKYREEPVYADKCDYEVTEWHVARTLVEKGGEDAPRWPAVAIARPGICLGCEREGAHTETYKVSLHDAKSGKDDECTVKPAQYGTFAKGTKWKGEVRVLTDGVDCDSLKPQ